MIPLPRNTNGPGVIVTGATASGAEPSVESSFLIPLAALGLRPRPAAAGLRLSSPGRREAGNARPGAHYHRHPQDPEDPAADHIGRPVHTEVDARDAHEGG